MESEILKLAMQYGVFPCLFIWLLFYVLKENGKREANYQILIRELTDRFKILECVQLDIREIKELVKEEKKIEQ